jgi:hypothetical protein
MQLIHITYLLLHHYYIIIYITHCNYYMDTS